MSIGGNFNYTVVVSNAGPSSASSVTLTDGTPANCTFVSQSQPSTGPQFTLTAADGKVFVRGAKHLFCFAGKS